MKMYEMKRDGAYDIGFIDPNTIHKVTVENQDYTKDTERILLKFSKELHTNAHILFPYNFK